MIPVPAAALRSSRNAAGLEFFESKDLTVVRTAAAAVSSIRSSNGPLPTARRASSVLEFPPCPSRPRPEGIGETPAAKLEIIPRKAA